MKIAGLDIGHIGMGNADTWHGSPDFRIGGGCVLSGDVEEDDPYDFEQLPLHLTFLTHNYLRHRHQLHR